ncbi:MAG: ABC transporter ATP-binding protein [Selenomonadaceae bacterium]|nr:ABC transporter ATP-binding protein [Selenomonadaceae bacterium]
MLLKISDLNILYGEKIVVNNVNFELNAGERLAIVGESGSGKTTLICACLGVLQGDGRICKGDILCNGKNLVKFTESDWKKIRGKEIAMIFQDGGSVLNPVHTIGKQFIEYIRLHSDVDNETAYITAVDMLKKMNLPNPKTIMNSHIAELSGGMRQRVGIAMAILFKPKLLLADEPTSALDATTQAQILKELAKITESAMIIVTHNIGVAAYLCDKIMVLQNGSVKEYGTTEDVLKNPKSDYTKTLLSATPEIGEKRYV